MDKNEDIKKFDQFVDSVNEELEQTTQAMQNTAQVYSKYKNKVISSIDKDDMQKSEEEFNSFIEGLPDNEKEASDMLRSLFSSEMIKLSIEKLQNDKKIIEEQINGRIKELKDIQSNLQ